MDTFQLFHSIVELSYANDLDIIPVDIAWNSSGIVSLDTSTL